MNDIVIDGGSVYYYKGNRYNYWNLNDSDWDDDLDSKAITLTVVKKRERSVPKPEPVKAVGRRFNFD
jgi:hypothetical protein